MCFCVVRSRFMDYSCTLESLEYFNYKNHHVLGPFSLTRPLSFLPKLGCVCLHRERTLSEHSDCFNIHLDSPIKNKRLKKLRRQAREGQRKYIFRFSPRIGFRTNLENQTMFVFSSLRQCSACSWWARRTYPGLDQWPRCAK